MLSAAMPAHYNDPHVPPLPKMQHHDLPEMKVQLTPSFSPAGLRVDRHGSSAYDYDFIVKHSKLVVDTATRRRCAEGGEKIRRA
jgi:UDP-N-acetyl-D-glucosamine dehydrogenase